MSSIRKRNTYVGAWLLIAAVGIFAPDLGNMRFLAMTATTTEKEKVVNKVRDLQTTPAPTPAPTSPPGTEFSCMDGYEKTRFDFSTITLSDPGKVGTETFSMTNGYNVTFTSSETGGAKLSEYDQKYSGQVVIGTRGYPDSTDVVDPKGTTAPTDYPDAYVTLTIEFDRPINGLLVAVTDLDSTSKNTDASRITLFDPNGVKTPTTVVGTGDIKVIDNFAYEPFPSRAHSGVGYDAAIYAKANGMVQKIKLDQSMFIWDVSSVGRDNSLPGRGVFPGADLQYCAAAAAATKTPASSTPISTPAPVVSASSSGGINGDPLIMGLQGQLFRFDGHNGAWYSAISTPSFQWNMRVTQFEGCPSKSDTFSSGAGFTFFDSKKRKVRTIEINVVNEHNVDIGCGAGSKSCLGAGSLEILIDGQKIVTGGDYQFEDKTGRVIAFNTFYQCSRKWYDFVVTKEEETPSLREARRLATLPGVFDVMDDLKETMIGKDVCEKWMADRQKLGDLFDQAGHYSTIIVKTDIVTFHVEYKQENERCNAHSLDVWMSAVSPSLLSETWEGIIGETKEPLKGEKKDLYDRKEVLKYDDDSSYEVSSPFSTKCKGCDH